MVTGPALVSTVTVPAVPWNTAKASVPICPERVAEASVQIVLAFHVPRPTRNRTITRRTPVPEDTVVPPLPELGAPPADIWSTRLILPAEAV